jgi:hypothetical protein
MKSASVSGPSGVHSALLHRVDRFRRADAFHYRVERLVNIGSRIRFAMKPG